MDTPVHRLSDRRALVALLFVCLIAWLAGFFTLPPLDRDESRFAQASKQMLETGDIIDIHLGEATRYEKPVGIYWLQAASTAALGAGARDRIWTYRVPSLLGGLAAVAATFWLTRAFAGVETAFAAGLLLGLSLLMMSEVKIAKTDAVLLGTVAVVQATLFRAYMSVRSLDQSEPPSKRSVLLGWAALGLGILVKGPVILFICFLSVLSVSLWDRDWSWLKRLHALSGLALIALMIVPWAVAIGVVSRGLFYRESLGLDFAMKVVGDAEAHGAPPGYFAALAHATFWPASFALLPGIALGFERKHEPAVRFLSCWALTTWLMFEFASTKLPHYVLPAYPALSVLCALWVTSEPGPESKALRISAVISLGLFVLVGLALAGFAVWAPERFGPGAEWWLYPGAGLGAVAVLSVPALARDRMWAAAMASLAAIILYQVVGFGTVPELTDLWLSPRLADAVERYVRPDDPPVVTAGYAEPSIRFLLGTRTKLLLGPEAGAAAAAQGGLALIEANERSGFLAAVRYGGAHADALEDIAGLDYSSGRRLAITLYRVSPDQG